MHTPTITNAVNEFNPPEKPENKVEEKTIIDKFSDEWQDIKDGQFCYLISSEWYNKWIDYVDKEGESPKAINNSDLKQEPPENGYVDNFILIKPNLQEKVDFFILTEHSWATLQHWYGGGPVIKRKVISEGEIREKRAEIYLIEIHVKKISENGEIDNQSEKIIYESKKLTIRDLENKLKKIFKVDPEKNVRIWNTFVDPPEPLWKYAFRTLEDVQIIPKQSILLDIKYNSNWVWNKTKKSGSLFSGLFNYITSFFTLNLSDDDDYDDFSDLGIGSGSAPSLTGGRVNNSIPGVCGLSNLGNTCFMNSALQCLSNAPALTEYFLSDKYKAHINRENPLGMKGQLAEQYATTIANMWSGEYTYVAPRNLKWTVGKFEPRFSGYQQQDAQEFLAFLLDGLHEDLNQVYVKPYVENKDLPGHPDAEVAEEAWKNHLKRNRSVIVDLFQAQLKSTVVCPKCDGVSITFDPFMYLSLPFPTTVIFEFIYFLPFQLISPIKSAIQISSLKSLDDFKRILYIQQNGNDDLLNSDSLVSSNGLSKIKSELNKYYITMVNNNRIIAIPDKSVLISALLPSSSLSHFSAPENVHVYEIPPSYLQYHCFHFLHRKQKIKRNSRNEYQLFGLPFVLFLPVLSGKQFYFYVFYRLLNVFTSDLIQQENYSSFLSKKEENDENFWEWVKSEAENFDFEKLPFELKYINSYGMICSECNIQDQCRGCKIIPDDSTVKFSDKFKTIIIEWTNPNYYCVENGNLLALSDDYSILKEKYSNSDAKSIHLTDCLNLFSETETLGSNDKWYCPSCKRFVKASKKIELWSSPEILIIHLKRFSQTRRSKINTEVTFPLKNFDLTPFLLDKNKHQNNTYDLFGLSQHTGSLFGGHYTALGLNRNGNWYSFNDQYVSPIPCPTTEEISSSSGYLLFYKRNAGPL